MDKETEEQVDKIIAMSDAELIAYSKRQGIDPDQAVVKGRALLDKALERHKATLNRVGAAIIKAQHTFSRDIGGFTYGGHRFFSAENKIPAPAPERYVIRDHAAEARTNTTVILHETSDRAAHDAKYKEIERWYLAQAAIRAYKTPQASDHPARHYLQNHASALAAALKLLAKTSEEKEYYAGRDYFQNELKALNEALASIGSPEL
jgi:hypothetical protein